MDKNWVNYEQYVFNHFRTLYPTANLQKNIHLKGQNSNVVRQIDFLIDFPDSGLSISIAVECKYFNKKVDVKIVDSFLGFLQDIKASKGILITNKGYTKAAQNRAANADRDIEVRIVEYGKLGLFQGFGGTIIFNDNVGIFFHCPKNWIVDNSIKLTFSAVYPYGLTFLRANELNEWIALRVFYKDDRIKDINALIEDINKAAESKYPTVTYCSLASAPPLKHKEFENLLRVCEYRPGVLEYSYFLDIGNDIANCVLYTPVAKKTTYFKIFKDIIDKAIVFKRHHNDSSPRMV